MLKKFFVTLTILVLVFSMFGQPTVSHAQVVDRNAEMGEVEIDKIVDELSDYYPNMVVDKAQIEAAIQLSDYFQMDADGKVEFTADKETLMEMGISEHDAELMIKASKEEFSFSEDNQLNGFVGVHLNLGPKVRGMAAWAAGIYAGAYVGWHIKKFAKTPHTAAVAALISATVGVVVGNAVRYGLRRVSIGNNIPGWSLSYTVNIP